MTGTCHLSRSAALAFGLLALAELMVVQLLGPAREGLVLLGALVALQLTLLWNARQVGHLMSQHAALKRAYENELRLNRETLEGVGHGLTLIDGDGRITYVNAECQSLTGYAPQDIVGRRPSDFSVDPELPPAGRPWQTELRCADGSLLRVMVQERPYWHHGRIVGHLASIMPLERRPQPLRELN